MQKTTAKNIIIGLIVLALAAVLVWAVAGRGGSAGDKYILYYREDCPHCKLVEQFMTDNQIETKLNIEKKEVKYSVKNNNELISRAKDCGLDTAAVGVPFLYDGAQCYMGEEPIINFFNGKL